MNQGATLSQNGVYRYDLWRVWDSAKPYVAFIGLNPSTADHTEDDPTIRRCKRFAKDWGFGGVYMVNLFAVRATDPNVMLIHRDPIGIDNDNVLTYVVKTAGLVVCAWGAHGSHQRRDRAVTHLLHEFPLFCLGTTKGGQPRHPLYIKADKLPELWSVPK